MRTSKLTPVSSGASTAAVSVCHVALALPASKTRDVNVPTAG